METIQATNLHEKLKSWMRKSERVLVAYSGGVDSSFLAHVATESLGFENAVVVTGLSASVSDHQLEIGKRIAKANGFNHFMLETKEFENPRYRANDGIRCYFCKDELYGRLTRFRDERFPGYVVVDGTNFDDLKDVRHGIKAADQHGVLSPLALNKLGKSMIRELSKDAGLETWDMPSSPCLASRVQIGVEVSAKRLGLVEKGEAIIRKAGFKEFRLRVNEEFATIQIATEEMAVPGFSERVALLPAKIRELGFDYVTIDPKGYRMGSANVKTSLVSIN